MACNWVITNGEITGVLNQNGERSKLYDNLKDKFGNTKATEMYAVSQSDEFKEVVGTTEDFKVVTRYITEQNKNTNPLTTNQRVDFINMSIAIKDFDINKLKNAFYDELGVFSISPKKLEKTGYYNGYEIAKLQSGKDLQQEVKNALEAVENTINLPSIEDAFDTLETTSEVNSFGKMNIKNPYEVQQEIEQALGDTTEEEFEQAVADLPYKTEKPSVKDVVAKLENNGLANKVFKMTNAEIEAKLIELGVTPDVAKQVVAWHGSPYSFDRFTTEKMGTGEGAQAFGWGLYFTDLKSIARSYADILSKNIKKQKTIFIDGENFSELTEFRLRQLVDIDSIKNKDGLLNRLYKMRENSLQEYNQMPNENLKSKIKPYLDALSSDILLAEKAKKIEVKEPTRNLYKVSLHKGKEAGEYTWLEWDKSFTTLSDKILEQAEKEGIKNILEDELKYLTKGEELYTALRLVKGSQKEASLFLLRAGIDGIKYPAESISRGATSDTARGFNYVVFDENAVTIEEQIQFQKQGIALSTTGFTYKGDVYLNMDKMSLDTPIHEFGHLFLNHLKEANPEVYQRGLELANSNEAKAYREYVEQTQPNLTGEEKLNEILAQAIGENGAKLVNKSWINSFWEEIKKLFGLTKYTTAQIQKMNLKQFTEEAAIDLLNEDLKNRMQQYVTAKELYEESGEIKERKNTETETTITQTAKLSNNVALINKINDVINIDDDILYDNPIAVQVLREVENELIEDAVDVIGLADRPINKGFLLALRNFLITPNSENTTAFSEAYDEHFESDLTVKETKVKPQTEKVNADYIKLNTTKTEEELYENNGLIKVEEGLYIEVAKQDLEELYSLMETYPEKLPTGKELRRYVREEIGKQDSVFKNAENAEAVYLYKMFYGIKETVKERPIVKQLSNFNGNIDYIREEFASDFYVDYLRAKKANNKQWKNFYSKFAVNEKGLYLKSTDPITLATVKEYADENLVNYSIVSKQMPSLAQETVKENSSRVDAINQPETVEKYKGQVYKLNDLETIIKNETRPFLKIGNEVYENISTNGILNLYHKLEKNNSEFLQLEAEQPTTDTNLLDYLHLNQTPEEFLTIEKQLSKQELEKVKKDNFDCD